MLKDGTLLFPLTTGRTKAANIYNTTASEGTQCVCAHAQCLHGVLGVLGIQEPLEQRQTGSMCVTLCTRQET